MTEAEDLIADLWSDCFGGRRPHCWPLSKYAGRCALESWLVTVAQQTPPGLRALATLTGPVGTQ